MISIGIDIGGTKCALSVGECSTDSVKILHREEFPTKGMRSASRCSRSLPPISGWFFRTQLIFSIPK